MKTTTLAAAGTQRACPAVMGRRAHWAENQANVRPPPRNGRDPDRRTPDHCRGGVRGLDENLPMLRRDGYRVTRIW